MMTSHRIARLVARNISAIPGTADVRIAQSMDYPIIHLEIDRLKAAYGGVTVEDIMASVSVFAGEPRRIIDYIHRAEEVGVDQLVLAVSPGYYPMDDLVETLDMWGEHIVPEFATGVPSSG